MSIYSINFCGEQHANSGEGKGGKKTDQYADPNIKVKFWKDLLIEGRWKIFTGSLEKGAHDQCDMKNTDRWSPIKRRKILEDI